MLNRPAVVSLSRNLAQDWLTINGYEDMRIGMELSANQCGLISPVLLFIRLWSLEVLADAAGAAGAALFIIIRTLGVGLCRHCQAR